MPQQQSSDREEIRARLSILLISVPDRKRVGNDEGDLFCAVLVRFVKSCEKPMSGEK